MINLINASAGSGKTYTLSQKILERIRSGTSPDRIFVTTFTVRAAQELKERVRACLLEAGETEAAAAIQNSLIGTVNALCSRLLREYAVDAGLSPAVDVIPEEESDTIFYRAIDVALAEVEEEIADPARRLSLDKEENPFKTVINWKTIVKDIVEKARSNNMTPDQIESFAETSWEEYRVFLPEKQDRDWNGEILRELEYSIQGLSRIPNPPDLLRKTLSSFGKICGSMQRGETLWANWATLLNANPSAQGREEVVKLRIAAEGILAHPLLQQDIETMIRLAFHCAAQAVRYFQEYKKSQGLMDYTDQEALVLDLATRSQSFRESLKSRLDIVMVDEFQDTSPIQLALFAALDELAGESIWVGDPKQSIYGFRGADPELMEKVTSIAQKQKPLEYSWRSRENLIEFTNAVFTKVFPKYTSKEVRLLVPEERKKDARGGIVEVWHLIGKKNVEDAKNITTGIRDLLEQNPNLKPCEIAVLCRKKEECTLVATMLENSGIRASYGEGQLLTSRECRLAICALRYMENSNDLLALAEIKRILSEPTEGKNWLSDLFHHPAETKEAWHSDPAAMKLRAASSRLSQLSLPEALEEAIHVIDLPVHIRTWDDASRAIDNLDVLRKLCRNYMEHCRSERSGATITGFIRFLNGNEESRAEGRGEDTVQVMTLHKSKGLEWKWVIYASLDEEDKVKPYKVRVDTTAPVDPHHALANRKICYWPDPFDDKKFPPLKDQVESTECYAALSRQEREENNRLLYVGMTRARDGLALAIQKSATQKPDLKMKTLERILDPSGSPVFPWTVRDQEHYVTADGKPIYIPIRNFNSSQYSASEMENRKHYLPPYEKKTIKYPPARLTPSKLDVDTLVNPSDEQSIPQEEKPWNIRTIATPGERMIISGAPDMDRVGNAIHAFLALDDANAAKPDRAERIVRNWDLEKNLMPEELTACRAALEQFLAGRYPAGTVYREWPIAYRMPNHTLVQGWIDMLIDTPEGYILIDHKTYPGKDPEQHAQQYIPQFRTYRDAIVAATGRPVLEILVHMPVQGILLGVERV